MDMTEIDILEDQLIQMQSLGLMDDQWEIVKSDQSISLNFKPRTAKPVPVATPPQQPRESEIDSDGANPDQSLVSAPDKFDEQADEIVRKLLETHIVTKKVMSQMVKPLEPFNLPKEIAAAPRLAAEEERKGG